MRLYLTSYRIPTPDDLFDLIGKRPKSIKTAVIPNAKDYYADRARNFKIGETTSYLKDLGIESKLFDLREFSDSKDIQNNLKGYDFIWVTGGNTFCLRHAMHTSGFDKAIKDLVEDGLVYGGESAGTVVAGNSLKYVELADEPEFSEKVLWDGLNLIPKYVLPHADNETFTDATKAVKRAYAGKPDFIMLNDSQALVVNGESYKIADSLDG